MKNCIIIPAFNEGPCIFDVIESIQKHCDAEIVVIDDGSVDDTAVRAEDAGALVISHPFNMGYGVALQTGYKYAVENNYDFLVQLDGDGQHDPKEIPKFLAVLTVSPFTSTRLTCDNASDKGMVVTVFPFNADMTPSSPLPTARTASAARRVANQRSNGVGLPPLCK